MNKLIVTFPYQLLSSNNRINQYNNINTYKNHFSKVAWLRVDTQTILTIQTNVITKNHRVAIGYTETRIWQLRIKDIRESDRGW